MYDDYIKKKLHETGYKLTGQRQAVLDVMIENRSKHLTAEEVLWEARKSMPNIGIATVYRTLEKLANIEVLHKTMFEGDKYRYELADPGQHQHHHVLCLSCGKIYEVSDDLLHALEEKLEKQGFIIVDHELKFYGYCPKCSDSLKK